MPMLPRARKLMMVTALSLIAACTGTPKQSASPPAPVTVDPTGEYDITFTDDGATRSGTMVVTGRPGEYTGQVNPENRPAVAISALAASGSQVIITGNIPQGVLLIRFRLTGDSLRGDWSLRNDGGRVTGVKRSRPRQ